MSEKENAPQRWCANEARGKYLQVKHIKKMKLSKARKAILQDLFGAVLVFVAMVLITMLLLLVEVYVC